LLITARKDREVNKLIIVFWDANGVSNLTPELLSNVNADFAAARRAGMKVIVRFGYTSGLRHLGYLAGIPFSSTLSPGLDWTVRSHREHPSCQTPLP
jgi:hypothetical protein